MKWRIIMNLSWFINGTCLDTFHLPSSAHYCVSPHVGNVSTKALTNSDTLNILAISLLWSVLSWMREWWDVSGIISLPSFWVSLQVLHGSDLSIPSIKAWTQSGVWTDGTCHVTGARCDMWRVAIEVWQCRAWQSVTLIVDNTRLRQRKHKQHYFCISSWAHAYGPGIKLSNV